MIKILCTFSIFTCLSRPFLPRKSSENVVKDQWSRLLSSLQTKQCLRFLSGQFSFSMVHKKFSNNWFEIFLSMLFLVSEDIYTFYWYYSCQFCPIKTLHLHRNLEECTKKLVYKLDSSDKYINGLLFILASHSQTRVKMFFIRA